MHVTHLGSALDGTRLDVSTLQEPYRLEGKKTMGVAVWPLPPRRRSLPTGGGTGLIGMWKAFEELARLGWIAPVDWTAARAQGTL